VYSLGLLSIQGYLNNGWENIYKIRCYTYARAVLIKTKSIIKSCM
jgi:hypothetical protein